MTDAELLEKLERVSFHLDWGRQWGVYTDVVCMHAHIERWCDDKHPEHWDWVEDVRAAYQRLMDWAVFYRAQEQDSEIIVWRT